MTRNAVIEESKFAERLLSAARRNAAAPSLLHKDRGTWVVRQWNEVLAEIDRLAAGLRHLGLASGGLVAVEGEITARLFLIAAAIRATGGRILPVPAGASRAERQVAFDDPALALVIAQGRDTLSLWSEIVRAGRRVPIIFDHATPDNKSPEEGIVTWAKLRTLGVPQGWSAGATVSSRSKTLPVTWLEEATGWPQALDIALDHWVSSGEPIALPELLAAATRDRLELRPQNWIASRARLEANERAIRDRLPNRGSLAGWLVDGALRGARAPWFTVTRSLLRHRLGFGHLQNIEVHTGYEPGGAPALFRQLDLDLTLVGQRKPAEPVTPAAPAFRRKSLAVAAAR